MNSRWIGFLLCLCVIASPCSADETITPTPTLPDGATANAPISREQGVKNWSSWGLGCCVVASQKANSNYLKIPEIGETLKRLSLQEPGGHDPQKLERVYQEAKKTHSDMRWEQWWNQPDGWERAKAWSAQGFPIGITWGTGKRYGMVPIAHMVSATHISDDWVQIKDNNFPEEYSTVPGPEGRRRIGMGGLEWYTVLIPPDHLWPLSGQTGLIAIGLAGFFLIAYGFMIITFLFAYSRRVSS